MTSLSTTSSTETEPQADDKQRLLDALMNETRTMPRQALLRRLWRLKESESANSTASD